MPELILALDVGTTSARAGVFGPDGLRRSMARVRLTSLNPAPGRVEQDANAVWRAARQVIRRAMASADCTGDDVAALGVTTQRASAVVWDRLTGKPVSPLVIWSDLRGVERAGQLMAAGHFVSAQQSATKLEAILAAVPDGDCLRARGRLAWGNIDSYLIWKLSGGAAHVTDRSQAWPSGYLNLMDLGWNRDLIDLQGLDPAMFPRLVDTWGPMAMTAPSVLGGAVPICADVADQQSALMAHGLDAGVAKVSYGTSATLNLSTPSLSLAGLPGIPPLITRSVGGDTAFCLEGMVLSAGSALDWLRAACGLGAHGPFEALAAGVPDSAGAAFLPALQGLGAPHPDPARRGALKGLNPAVGRAHLARAGLEGLAFRVREAAGHVFALEGGAAPEVLNVDGGLTANDTFLQIQANLLGRPVRRHAAREATLAGAALSAGLGAGALKTGDAAAFARYDRVFAPAVGADEADALYAAWRTAVYE